MIYFIDHQLLIYIRYSHFVDHFHVYHQPPKSQHSIWLWDEKVWGKKLWKEKKDSLSIVTRYGWIAGWNAIFSINMYSKTRRQKWSQIKFHHKNKITIINPILVKCILSFKFSPLNFEGYSSFEAKEVCENKHYNFNKSTNLWIEFEKVLLLSHAILWSFISYSS